MSRTGAHGNRAAQRGRRSPDGGRASVGTAVAILISAAVIGFAGGAVAGNTAGSAGSASDLPAGASPDGTDSSGDAGDTSSPSDSATSDHSISLTSPQDGGSVSGEERIDLEGQLEPAEGGVTLTVERSIDGGDFETFPGGGRPPITAETNDDGSFSTYVQSGREGVNEWRLVGTVDGEFVTSESVTVTIN